MGGGSPNGNYFYGCIEFAVNLPWKGITRIVSLMEEKFGVPAVLTNDANAATIGEMIYGNAKGMRDFVMITLGTGLGSGFVANGEMVYGHDGFAGEFGHIPFFDNEIICSCGKKGCLETEVSGIAIEDKMSHLIERGVITIL